MAVNVDITSKPPAVPSYGDSVVGTVAGAVKQIAIGSLQIAFFNAQTGSYTLTATDAGKTLLVTSASGVNVTVPAGLGAGFQCSVVQLGAGQVTLVASSTTIQNRQSYTKTAGQYAIMSLLAVASNAFVSFGDGA
jgi:hypothetical protein